MVSSIVLIMFSLGVGYLIGLFHKQTGRNMKLVFFYVRRVEMTRKNLQKIPQTLKRILTVLRKRRPLLLLKMRKKYREAKRLSPTTERSL